MTDARQPTCFVIGPIGNRHAPAGSDELRIYEEALEVFEMVIRPACEAVGLQPVRADGLYRAGEIPEQVYRRLHSDDVVIADVTDANPNVMYELGLRHTRNKMTLQIGEYGRLPFDVSVIRTIQFSRSELGLIKARRELVEFLESGLEGEFDPVSATRVWSELQGEVIEPEREEPSAGEGGEQEVSKDDAPGYLDLIAEGEEQQERLTALMNSIAAHVESLGALAEEAAEKTRRSDAQGKGMKGRLAVLVEFANGLNDIAEELEDEVSQFEQAMAAVSGGNLALIERVEADPSQLEEPNGQDWALVLRRLATTSRENSASLSELVETMTENAKMSRVLREPTRRVTDALHRFSGSTAVMDEWDRRLQALGVPVPPEDWEPEDDHHDEDPRSSSEGD